ncbi:hypothetical protein HDV05_008251 [Chytridiales sp. JEL 0842]|nr:hypothetical protein HDV05_008251 [Chytridiales sp. JEL 0842]
MIDSNSSGGSPPAIDFFIGVIVSLATSCLSSLGVALQASAVARPEVLGLAASTGLSLPPSPSRTEAEPHGIKRRQRPFYCDEPDTEDDEWTDDRIDGIVLSENQQPPIRGIETVSPTSPATPTTPITTGPSTGPPQRSADHIFSSASSKSRGRDTGPRLRLLNTKERSTNSATSPNQHDKQQRRDSTDADGVDVVSSPLEQPSSATSATRRSSGSGVKKLNVVTLASKNVRWYLALEYTSPLLVAPICHTFFTILALINSLMYFNIVPSPLAMVMICLGMLTITVGVVLLSWSGGNTNEASKDLKDSAGQNDN